MRLAEHLGVNAVLVSQWTADQDPRPVPVRHRPGIEQFTAGAVPVESYGDDTRWSRIRDRAWPWCGGKPHLDVMASG